MAVAVIVLGPSCSGGGDGTTEPRGPRAASVQAITATQQQSRVNRPVDEPPGVLVRDQNGNPMSGVMVAFSVTEGAGSISPPTVVTGGDGTAQLANWSLGAIPGANSVTATVSGLTPVIFNATATQTPASMQAVTPTSQEAPAGTAVSQPPGVIIRDIDNTPMPGVSVTFAVTFGGGSITPSTVVTGADGIARLTTWVMGPNPGQNTVTAMVAGLPVLTFNATGMGCPAPMDVPLPTTLNGTLGASTCVLSDGEFVELYQFTVAEQKTVRIMQSSAAIDTYLLLSTAAGDLVAENDDLQSGGSTNSEIMAVLKPGTYVIGASSFNPGETGAFTIRVEESVASVANCNRFFVMPGVSTSQSLSAADCLSGAFRSDFYLVYLKANEQVTIVMNSSQLDAYLILYKDPFVSPAVVGENNDKALDSTDARIVYTPALAGYYLIEASSAIANQTGVYTLVTD